MSIQVPYSGAPEVGPQGAALPQVHEDAPAAAFGATVAQAVQHVGDVAQGAGKELFARAVAFQEMDEQVKADIAATDTTDKQTQLYLDYSQKKGMELVQANPKYNEDLEKIRTDNAAGLNSPYARQRYLQESRRGQSQMIWHGAVLARNGQETAAEAALKGKADAIAQRYATLDPNDEKAWNDTVAASKDIFADQVHQKTGFAPGSKENDQGVAPMLSKQVTKLLLAKSNSDHPEVAKQLFAKAKQDGIISPEDADAIQQRIDNSVDNKLGRKIGTQIASDPKVRHATPTEVEKAAREEARKRDPGNKVLEDNAADAAVARQSHEKNLEKTSWQETQTTLIQGIDGSTTNGKVPLSLEEAQKDPKWNDMYNSLPAAEQGKVREQIFRNQSTGGYVENEEGNRQFQNLYAALKDPRASAAEVDAALNVDLLSTPMTREQRKTIMDLQASTLKEQSNQSNINSALNVAEVQQALRAAGISKKDDPDGYNEFVTKFTEAVGEYADAAHRSVKDHKQLGEIANTMLMHQAGKHFWNSDSGPAYKTLFDARPDLKAKAFATWKEAYGTEPTPEQLESLAPAFYKAMFTDLGMKSRPSTTKRDMQVKPKSAGDSK